MNRADRKKQLIAQGAVYRAEVILAKQAMQVSLQPDSLAKSALHQIALAAFSLLKNRGAAALPGVNLQTVVPLVMAGVSALSKRKDLVKPVLRGALVAGAVAGVVAFIAKKKKAAQAGAADNNAEPDFVGPE